MLGYCVPAAEGTSSCPLIHGYSVYIHVPFCLRKCPYCHFFVTGFRKQQTEPFTSSIIREWRLRRPPSDALLQSIYFGGGTPSLLEPEQIGRILEEILSDVRADDALEVTLEINPEDVTLERLQRFRAAGINRVSLGVQSFVDSELKLLGRMHSGAGAQEAVLSCYAAGLSNISIDLMFDQPGQSLDSWHQSVTTACDLPISHISLYNLTIEPHTAFWRKRKLLQAQQPDESVSAQMLQAAEGALQAHHIERYEISAFSKARAQSKHNLGYWLSRPFIGLGPSAWSDWNNLRFKNCANLVAWQKQITQGNLAVDEKDHVSTAERIHERFAVALRVLSGICLVSWQRRFGPLTGALDRILTELTDAQLLVRDGSRISLSARGRMLYDEVAAEIVCP